MTSAIALAASQMRKKEEMESQYEREMSRLKHEVEELRQQQTADCDDTQSTAASSSSSSSSSTSPSGSELRHYISRLERHEDRHLKDQLKLVKVECDSVISSV